MKFNRDNNFVSLVQDIKINNFIKDSVFSNTLIVIYNDNTVSGRGKKNLQHKWSVPSRQHKSWPEVPVTILSQLFCHLHKRLPMEKKKSSQYHLHGTTPQPLWPTGRQTQACTQADKHMQASACTICLNIHYLFQSRKMLKITLCIRTKHNMQIFRLIPFIALQNNT